MVGLPGGDCREYARLAQDIDRELCSRQVASEVQKRKLAEELNDFRDAEQVCPARFLEPSIYHTSYRLHDVLLTSALTRRIIFWMLYVPSKVREILVPTHSAFTASNEGCFSMKVHEFALSLISCSSTNLQCMISLHREMNLAPITWRWFNSSAG